MSPFPICFYQLYLEERDDVYQSPPPLTTPLEKFKVPLPTVQNRLLRSSLLTHINQVIGVNVLYTV